MLYKLIAFNGRFIHSCLALFYLREALAANVPGCKPELVQYTISDPYYPVLRCIGSGEPAALFFSVYIWNSTYIQRLIEDLAWLLPQTPVVLGGPQAGALFKQLAPEVVPLCTLVQGEVEGLRPQFYQDLAAGKLQRQYSCTKPATFKSPYKAADFAEQLKNRNVYYESSRGCPFGCTYCLSSAEKGVRHLPTLQVFEELREILRHNPRVVRFVDRTFNDLPERSLEIWRFLAEQQGETLFHFEMAPDRFTEEMFRFLEKIGPGKFQFELGIQSTNPQTLEAINRKCDPAKLVPAISRLVSLDTIHIHLDLILGLPYEDRETFARSFADVFQLGPHYIQMGLLKVLPDTPISQQLAEHGLVVCKKPPYEILANRWLDKVELEELFWLGECFESFYNNRYFRQFWSYLRRRGEDIFAFFCGLLELCRGENFFGQAHTQEYLNSLLLELTSERRDAGLIREILIFDWLRCGHHFLPGHFREEPVSAHRKLLWKNMDQNIEGLYDYRSRDEFFKQGVFMGFSGKFLEEVGLSAGDQPAHICFTGLREETVFRHNRIVVIPGEISRR